ncbi:MAG: hypothetical protein FJ278_09640 [Planctomycetes bacterium]|nr:hypothetical protein [Planctomycetota bacterium]
MELQEMAESIRAELVGHREGGRTHDGYPAALRSKIVEYAGLRRQKGTGSWSVARELGVAASSLDRWLRNASGSCGPRRSKALVPVVVRKPGEENARKLVVVTPRGYRVEGLGLDAAVALLRGLE